MFSIDSSSPLYYWNQMRIPLLLRTAYCTQLFMLTHQSTMIIYKLFVVVNLFSLVIGFMSQHKTTFSKTLIKPGLIKERHGKRLSAIKGSIVETKGETGINVASPAKNVYLFCEGNKHMRDILGGKGANLAEMVSIGLPVPPGFIISTKVCNEYFKFDDLPPEVENEYMKALADVEKEMGRRFADENEMPLLLSVRSGAVASMPGMMDTILNLGLNDKIVDNLIKITNNPRWVYDTYRRFIQMFSNVVMDVDNELFENALTELKREHGVNLDLDLDSESLKELVYRFQKINPGIPADPKKQLEMSIKAVFRSWNNPRAIRYRTYNDIPHDSGTAVNVQSMVFGNMNQNCGSGVGFTRNPANGDNQFFGEYLVNAQGEDVVAGIRTPEGLESMKNRWPKIYSELLDIRNILENQYKDMQDIEFTIENTKLFMLQTRTGKRTAKASVKMALDMFHEDLISKEQAILRVEPDAMDFFLHPNIDPNASKTIIASGLPASPGAATGMVVFTPEDAEKTASDGTAVILVRRDTTAEDIHGMKASAGILTQLGGMTSHAAVVARGMGTTCVSGCSSITVDVENETMLFEGGQKVIRRGDIITLDGTSGEVFLGDVPKSEPGADSDFLQILEWADGYRDMCVRANADSPNDARLARKLGAEGIGLCRTEHMFFDPDRIVEMRAMILAETPELREEQLNKLFVFQERDMIELFQIMNNLPVTIRLLDPPLHEFLPKDDDACDLLGDIDEVKGRCEELQEINPMMGFRGCRLCIVQSEITIMQVQAIISAACKVKELGGSPYVEIMIPFVSSSKELDQILPIIKQTAIDVLSSYDFSIEDIPYKIGTMIEVPRACLEADKIVSKEVDFISFGTNDLTQFAWGMSRDDMSKFVPAYIDSGILEKDPFITIDKEGVGSLIRIALLKSLPTKPDLDVGVCGEHGGDPKSIEYFHDLCFDYISCSPYRVPTSKMAAAHAVIKKMDEKVKQNIDTMKHPSKQKSKSSIL